MAYHFYIAITKIRTKSSVDNTTTSKPSTWFFITSEIHETMKSIAFIRVLTCLGVAIKVALAGYPHDFKDEGYEQDIVQSSRKMLGGYIQIDPDSEGLKTEAQFVLESLSVEVPTQKYSFLGNDDSGTEDDDDDDDDYYSDESTYDVKILDAYEQVNTIVI